MIALQKHSPRPVDPHAVRMAEQAIEQRQAAPVDEREARIDAALNKLKYGAALPAGYHYDGALLRLR